jgi:transcriptional regulator with GAF, ATPase, and Fis domain
VNRSGEASLTGVDWWGQRSLKDGRLTREERLARTLVELADTRVDDFDVVDLMSLLVERSVELLDAAAAGLVLADSYGSLRLMASTSEAMELVELFQVQNDQGPCFDCYRSGEPVIAEDLAGAADRWPRFAPFAINAGFSAAHALPMRLRRQVIGALNLFRTEPGTLDHADVYAGQALADLATIAILQAREVHDTHAVVDQLQHALQSRIIIEQAKGVLAERAGIGMEVAFSRLRAYARAHQLKLARVAEDVIAGTLHTEEIVAV